jgi:hypothetical protein
MIMQRFIIRTLVDITKTGIHKDLIDPIKKSQQDNFQTLLQTLEMRSNIFFDKGPAPVVSDWSKQGYSKREKTWVWEIYTEQDDIFKIGQDPIGAMKKDIEFIPFTAGCEETAKFRQCFFSPEKKPTNIIFEVVGK